MRWRPKSTDRRIDAFAVEGFHPMHRSACLVLSMMMLAALVAPASAQSVPSTFPIKADDVCRRQHARVD
jgi:hypothetical protein